MERNRIFSLLGLATKSRNLVSGEFMTEKAIKNGSAALVLVGTDASNNTQQMFRNKCEFYHVPMYLFGTKEELGHAMGKEMRSSLAVLDRGFARSIRTKIDQWEETSKQRDGGSEHDKKEST